jgi:hypothetical protein
MSTAPISAAIAAGDKLLNELKGEPGARLPSPAPTMGRLKKCNYTHDALIDLIIEHPELDQNHLAAHFGYTAGWISNILASDAFQTKLALRRDEVIDPEIKATLEERFRALVIKSLAVLSKKLDSPVVSDQVAVRAAELGAKALGMGAAAPLPPADNSQDRLERLAERLLKLQGGIRERVLTGNDGAEISVVRDA